MKIVTHEDPVPFAFGGEIGGLVLLAVTLIDTMDGALILKHHDHRVHTVAGLAEEHGFIAHLAGAGTPVPNLLRTADGTSAVAMDGPMNSIARGQGTMRIATGRHGCRSNLGPMPMPVPLASHWHDCIWRRTASMRRVRVAQPLVASVGILSAVAPLTAAEAYVDARPALAVFLAGQPWRRQLSSLFSASGDGLGHRIAD